MVYAGRYYGISGIYDVIVRAANSALAKKVINSAVDKAATSTIAKNIINSGVTKKVLDSAVGKTIAENITRENFKKAAHSAIGNQLAKVVAEKVDDAFEKAKAKAGLQKLRIPTSQNTALAPSEIPNTALVPSEIPNTPLIPSGTKRSSSLSRKKGKRRKTGNGIIFE